MRIHNSHFSCHISMRLLLRCSYIGDIAASYSMICLAQIGGVVVSLALCMHIGWYFDEFHSHAAPVLEWIFSIFIFKAKWTFVGNESLRLEDICGFRELCKVSYPCCFQSQRIPVHVITNHQLELHNEEIHTFQDDWLIAKILVPCILCQITAYMIFGTLLKCMLMLRAQMRNALAKQTIFFEKVYLNFHNKLHCIIMFPNVCVCVCLHRNHSEFRVCSPIGEFAFGVESIWTGMPSGMFHCFVHAECSHEKLAAAVAFNDWRHKN